MEMKAASGRELRWMKKIYLEAFPKSERKPFGMMKYRARQGTMELFVIKEERRPVGLAITVLYHDLVLLDYFAIDRAVRGQAYGSRALQLLKEHYKGKRFLLEIELLDDRAPNQEARIQRKHFYLKNGMKETGLQVCVFQVPMEVLTDGSSVTYEEYHELYRDSIGAFFARKVTRL